MTTRSKSFLVRTAALAAAALLFAACSKTAEKPAPPSKTPESVAADARLNGSFREDRGGWAYIHLQGAPRDIGYQHGWHMAAEIDDILKTLAFYFEKTTNRKWPFFREAA